MWRYIENLREKPEAVRRRSAFIISAIFVGIIAIISFAGLMYSYGHSKDTATENAPSPLNAMIQNIRDGVASVKDGIATSTEPADSGVIITDPGTN